MPPRDVGLCLALSALCQLALAGSPEVDAQPLAGCQPCVTHSCRLQPETKPIMKTVYEVREVPYCLKKLPPLFSHHRCGCCGHCDECQCVRYKKVLVKKQVPCGEICTTKCVVEEHVQLAPCLPGCK